MNYYEIGQRIRKTRKACGISQEQLAESAGISVTHMSHIETGNTKLSLPVLVSIAQRLDIRVDDLLFARSQMDRSSQIDIIIDELADCSNQQLRIIADTVRAIRISLKKHL